MVGERTKEMWIEQSFFEPMEHQHLHSSGEGCVCSDFTQLFKCNQHSTCVKYYTFSNIDSTRKLITNIKSCELLYHSLEASLLYFYMWSIDYAWHLHKQKFYN